jgi:hypothetical protein
MSGATGQPQEEDKKPNDQSAHINLKVKGQVCFCLLTMSFYFVMGLFLFCLYIFFVLVLFFFPDLFRF